MKSASRLALAAGVVLAFLAAAPVLADGPNDALPEAPAKAVLIKACTGCHEATIIAVKPRSAAEWDDIIGKMMDRGAQLTEADQDQVLDYLSKNFGVVGAALSVSVVFE